MNEATDKDIVEYYQGRDELLIKTARNNYDKGYEAAQEEFDKILDDEENLIIENKDYSDKEKNSIIYHLAKIKQRIKEE